MRFISLYLLYNEYGLALIQVIRWNGVEES